jgi:sigma-B regulation protein RsbU (phosphoserine phosphatase)
MPLPDPIRRVLKKLGWAERIFITLVAIYLTLVFLAPASGWVAVVQICAFFLAMFIAVRLLRFAARHAIWRLRNRLIVTYLFIGAVPILLIGALVGLTIYAMASQFAV